MKKELRALQKKMEEKGIDAYIVPTTDFHGSEYVHEHFKCREYVSGFSGSAGTLAVTQNAAALWTDGRYFLQAAEQLAGSGIELMREGEPGVPELTEWLEHMRESEIAAADQTQAAEWIVGFDGRIMNRQLGEKLAEGFVLESRYDLVGEIWKNRPELSGGDIYALPISVTGESSADKLTRIRRSMAEAGADCLLISSPEESAWLFNLRGSDIAHTPVFYAFTLILPHGIKVYLLNTSDRAKSLFDDIKLAGDGVSLCEGRERIETRPYLEIFSDLKKLGGLSLMLDENSVSFGLAEAAASGTEKILCAAPAALMKAVKNEAELSSSRNAHIRDGAALTEFIYRLKLELKRQAEDEKRTRRPSQKRPLTELAASELLWEERKKQGAFDTSFDTIAAYGEHGAIIHYEPTGESDVPLKNEGFLLLDSGGQYADGTTDISRTLALGSVSEEMKRCYTAVLKSHIALATAIFDEKTTGAELDALARKPLRDRGMDYKHGTGHGVGHMLAVHEGPNTISPRGTNSHITAGMITSNEPGVYFEGKFGIRLENEILCVELGASAGAHEAAKTAESKAAKQAKARKEAWQAEGRERRKFAFETISFCPFERSAIEVEMLTAEERVWLNSYHAEVYKKLSPLLASETQKWLAEETAPL